MGDHLTIDELALLNLVNDYGDGISFAEPRIPAKVKGIARDLIKRGYLSGKINNCCLTENARAAIKAVTD